MAVQMYVVPSMIEAQLHITKLEVGGFVQSGNHCVGPTGCFGNLSLSHDSFELSFDDCRRISVRNGYYGGQFSTMLEAMTRLRLQKFNVDYWNTKLHSLIYRYPVHGCILQLLT